MSHEAFFKRLPQYQGDESGSEGEDRDHLEFFSPEFPIHALPPTLLEIVGHFSTHNRVPVSANATAALGVLGACAGRVLTLRSAPASLWVPWAKVICGWRTETACSCIWRPNEKV